jgi:hypothetical protein
MTLGTPGRPKARLGVIPMALALVVAAFLGASLGLVWQSTGLGKNGSDDAENALSDGDSGAEEADEQNVPTTPQSG